MVRDEDIPCRGDIVKLNFSPTRGHEQYGYRPALVLSTREFNAITGLALLCPITSTIRGYPFEVRLPPSTGSITGVILSDQLRSLDWRSRSARFVERVADQTLAEVQAKINSILF